MQKHVTNSKKIIGKAFIQTTIQIRIHKLYLFLHFILKLRTK